MADTALARLRGILAATMPRTAIDVLIAEVRTEWDEQQAPAELCWACQHPVSSHPEGSCTRRLHELPSCTDCAAVLSSLRKLDDAEQAVTRLMARVEQLEEAIVDGH